MVTKYKVATFLGIALLAASLTPGLSYADWGHHGHGGGHYYRYHERPHYGFRLSLIPNDYFSFSLGTSRYYYYDGVYYSNWGTEYVVVNPPVGAVVRTIPVEYKPVIINGTTYYTDNGIYYVYTRDGYQVVPQPTIVVQQAPVVVTQPTTTTVTQTVIAPTQVTVSQTGSDESFTVNVPNDKGGYTAVVIKRTNNGFIGPQGEFYSDFPKVAQLKAMYTK